ARWTNARLAPAGRSPTAAWPNMRNTAPTASPKASCRCARKCARPSRCSPATARSSRRSTRSASPSAATAPAPGAGRPPIARPSAHRVEHISFYRLPGEGRDPRFNGPSACQVDPGLRREDGKKKRGRIRMKTLVAALRNIIGALALVALALTASPAAAQQPNSVDPTKSAVSEEQLLQQFKTIQGKSRIPDTKSYTLEQPAGRDWRHFHEVTLRWVGAIAILGILLVLVAFYLARGMVRIAAGRSGRVIVRFNALERFVHWITA